jgi:hypothetical protein
MSDEEIDARFWDTEPKCPQWERVKLALERLEEWNKNTPPVKSSEIFKKKSES